MVVIIFGLSFNFLLYFLRTSPELLLNPVRTVSLTFCLQFSINPFFFRIKSIKDQPLQMFCLLVISNTLFFGLPLTLWVLPTNEVVLRGSKWCLLDYMCNATLFYVLAYKNQHVLLMYPDDVAATWVPCHLPLSMSVLFRCSMRAPFLFLSLFNYYIIFPLKCISLWICISHFHLVLSLLAVLVYVSFTYCFFLFSFFFTCSNQPLWSYIGIWSDIATSVLVMTFCIRLGRTLNLTAYHLFMSEDQRKEKNNSIFLIIRDELDIRC